MINSKNGRRAAWLAGTMLAALAAGPVQAQQAANNVDELVVTAQRREQRLQDVPLSVSVVTGEKLAAAGVRTIQDMGASVPNVKIQPAFSTDLLIVRGVGSGFNAGFEQAVPTFVDGVYRGRARASRLALFDVDRVEVLRGPQTTFFGNNAIAGALNITTKKPGESLAYNASALYGDDGEYIVEGGVSMPLSDTFALRLAGQVNGMDGYITNRRDASKGPNLNDKVGRVALRWSPSSQVEVNARLDAGSLRDKGIFNSEMENCPPPANFGAPRGGCARDIAQFGAAIDSRFDYSTVTGPSRQNLDFLETAVQLAVQADSFSVHSTTSYYKHDYDVLLDALPAQNGSAFGGPFGLPTQNPEDVRQFTQEVRIESTGDGALEWMGGVYYARTKIASPFAVGFLFSPFGAFAPGFAASNMVTVLVNNRETDNLASAFGSLTVKASDRLRVNLGARYSEVKKRAYRTAAFGSADQFATLASFQPGPAAGQAVLFGLLGVDAGDYARNRRKDNKFMPSASVQYDLTPDAMGYVSFARGQKAGGFAYQLSNSVFEPETVDSFEGGVKSTLLGGRATLNVTGFISKYKNMQEATSTVQPSGALKVVIANVAASTSKGIEVFGAVRPTDRLTFSTELALLSSKYTRYPNGPCTALQNLTPNCLQNLSGRRRPFAPKFSGNFTAAYAQPLTDSLTLRADASVFTSSKYFQQANLDPYLAQPSYTKVDARVALGPPDRRWEMAVIGRNLTDRKTAGFRSSLPGSPGVTQLIPDRPRSVAVQVSIKN